MKSSISSIATILLVLASPVSSFAPLPPSTAQSVSSSSTAVRLGGIFDFFSEEARAAREEKRQREIEEQEKAQAEILEMRVNPEKRAEYDARVKARRSAYQQGLDGDAVAKQLEQEQEKKSEN